MRLSLVRLARFVFGFCLLLLLFGSMSSPLRAAGSNLELAWAWSVNCPCSGGCECTPASNCGCLPTVSVRAEPVGFREVQVCENGTCKIVRVPVYAPAQMSEPMSSVWANSTAGDCVGGTCFQSTTVNGSGGRLAFRSVQNARTWKENRLRLFGGNRLFGGCCR